MPAATPQAVRKRIAQGTDQARQDALLDGAYRESRRSDKT